MKFLIYVFANANYLVGYKNVSLKLIKIHLFIRKHRDCTYIITGRPQLVKSLDVEPRALVARDVQSHPHGVLLEQRRKPLVDGEELVAFEM